MPDVTYVWIPQDQEAETWIPYVVQRDTVGVDGPRKCNLPFFLFSVGAKGTGSQRFIVIDKWIKQSDRVEIWVKEP